MNILVLSAGRRTSLVNILRQAVADHGGSVVAADIDGLAPALQLADRAVRLPRVGSEHYRTVLREIVDREQIHAVVPTIDTELACLSAMRDELAGQGCTAVVSGSELIDVTADKQRTSLEFGARGVRVPSTIEPDADDLPQQVFVKPRFGSASVGASVVSREDLATALNQVEQPIVQELIEATEVTVDALLDLDGRPVHYVPRRRLKTLGGESIQGVTIDDHAVRDWLVQLLDICSSMGGRGPITIQYFETPTEPTLLEVNPRFGGGFPLCHHAGGRYGDWLVEMLQGEKIAPRLGDYQRDLYMTRALTEQFVAEPLWH